MQSRRNKNAAKKFFRKLFKRLRYVPRVISTDKRKSYGAANIVSIAISTTARQTLINQPVSGNSACQRAKRPDMPSAFLPLRSHTPNTFDRDGICYQPPHTVKKSAIDSRVGLRSRVRDGLPKRQEDWGSVPVCLMMG